MADIENILKVRKEYSSKIYAYFHHIQPKLFDIITKIEEDGKLIRIEENKIWENLKKKKNTLLEFEKEISTLSRAQGILDQKRISEIQALRKKLEFKILTNEKNYQKFLNLLQEKENEWKEEIYDFLLKDVNKQKILISLGEKVDDTYLDFKNYCENWRKEPIERLLNIIKDSKNIETTAQNICHEIKELTFLKLDEEYIANLKSIQIPQSCNALSKELERFIMKEDYVDLLGKIEKTHPYIKEFFEIFQDTSFSSIRTSIRLVNNIHTTEKKLNTIEEKFNHIQDIFNEVLEKIQTKKEDLISLCTTKEELTKKICEKWVNFQYKNIVNINQDIINTRNEFLINDNIN